MTKRDLVIRISNDTNLIQQDVLTVVQKTLDYITEALIKGETVELRNFARECGRIGIDLPPDMRSGGPQQFPGPAHHFHGR